MLQQIGAHAVGFGVGFVDLVDGDDDRNLGRLGVIDGFHRLRHDAVVGRHHQHDDVGDLGAARAHGGEGRVAGRVDESDLGARRRGDLVSADVLGDAAGFACRDVRRADGIEQRRLAVVDMAHDGNDRRARRGRFRLVHFVEQALFHVGFRDAAHAVAHFFGDQLRGVGVDGVVDLQHLALLHQQADHIDRAFRHAVGEIGNGDDVGNGDFTHELFFRLVRSMSLEALGTAAERGDRTLAHFIGAQGGDQREAAAFFRRRATRRCRTGGGRTRGAGPARLGRAVIVLGFRRHAAGGQFLDLVLAETLLGDFAGFALGVFLGLVARFFLALARLSGFAFGLVDAFAALTAAGFFLGDFALFGFAHARIGERMSARDALFFGQSAQNDAGSFRRFGGRGGW